MIDGDISGNKIGLTRLWGFRPLLTRSDIATLRKGRVEVRKYTEVRWLWFVVRIAYGRRRSKEEYLRHLREREGS